MWIFRLFFALILLVATERAAFAEIRRVAIVVGTNRAPPGRAPLRYAHEDARRVVDVLSAVAGFPARDIRLLLDPEPAALLAALDRELELAAKRSDETLLFFYYSGHADQHSLFPAGLALPFTALKTRLEDRRAKLRVGLLDSCSGGAWTGSKGLKKVEPFQIDSALQLVEEGSVLIASSSGEESAHETEALQGSFFTHYWNAGLRGAADGGGDGVVTLGEAFEYARSLTIRDTALIGQAPQHPSFQMKLSGRRDFALATLARENTSFSYEQLTGPTEIVRLSDGLVVVEVSPGPRRVRLGLPPGNYLVRRRAEGAVFARIVPLAAGRATTLSETQLERSTLSPGRAKGGELRELDPITWSKQRFATSLAVGVRHAPVIDPGIRAGAADGRGIFLARGSLRIVPRLWWWAPLALVFDAERAAPFNFFAWAGLPTLSVSRGDDGDYVFGSALGTGFDARFKPAVRHAFNASLSTQGNFQWGQKPPDTWAAQLTLGMSETIPELVTFSAGMGASANYLASGSFSSASLDSLERNAVISFGSVQRAGLRALPLIFIPLGDGWGIDVHAVGAYRPAHDDWVETYMAGVSYGLY